MAVAAPFLISLAISLAISIVAYALMPKPQTQKPPAAQDLENPTAEAGRPIPVVFGRVRVKGVNILLTADKGVYEWETGV